MFRPFAVFLDEGGKGEVKKAERAEKGTCCNSGPLGHGDREEG